MSIRGHLDAADQARSAVELDRNLHGKGAVERRLNLRTLGRRQLKCAAHTHLLGRLQRLREHRVPLAVQRPQALDEHRDQALLQTRPGEISECLARDGEDLLLNAVPQGLVELIGFLSQGVLAIDAQGIGSLPGLIEQPLALGVRRVRHLDKERRALGVERLVFLLSSDGCMSDLMAGVPAASFAFECAWPRRYRPRPGC